MSRPPQAQRLLAALTWQRVGVTAVVLAQCLGTSLWFSPAGAASGLLARWQLQGPEFAWLLAATQLGFIGGSLMLALGGVADRWPASRVFALASVVGAAANAALVLPGTSFAGAWGWRFGVGVCLAGIYPLGMKLVVQWVGGKPALALAWLVAMLTLGTAMPHALRALGVQWPWQSVLLGASVLALLGAGLVAAVGDGGHRPPTAAPQRLGLQAVRALLRNPGWRASAGAYVGHMWELYAFWAVVPLLCGSILRSALADPTPSHPSAGWAWLAALVIGVGALGCLIGGYAVRALGSAKVAFTALAGSGLVCLLYPLVPPTELGWRVLLLLCWGALVVADSPQFSALSSQAVAPQDLGLALVLQNGVGFLVSVVSIVGLGWALGLWGERALWLLLPGPVLGLWTLRRLAWPPGPRDACPL